MNYKPTIEVKGDGNSVLLEYPLTKREEFAKAAMQGLLSNSYMELFRTGQKPEEYAVNAIEIADALLKQLDGGKQ